MTLLRKEAPTRPPPHREHRPADTVPGSSRLPPGGTSSVQFTRQSPPHPPTTGNRLKLRPQADSVSLLPHAACLSPSVVGVPPSKAQALPSGLRLRPRGAPLQGSIPLQGRSSSSPSRPTPTTCQAPAEGRRIHGRNLTIVP